MPSLSLIFKTLNQIGALGTKEGYDARTNSKISLTNFMAITLAIISFPFSFQFYYLGFNVPGLLVIIIVLFYLFALFLNYIHWHNIAKIWLIIVADLADISMQFSLENNQVFVTFFYPMYVFPFYFLNLKIISILFSVHSSVPLYFLFLYQDIMTIPNHTLIQ